MAAIGGFLGILSGALAIGLLLKSTDNLFEWADERSAPSCPCSYLIGLACICQQPRLAERHSSSAISPVPAAGEQPGTRLCWSAIMSKQNAKGSHLRLDGDEGSTYAR